MDTQRCQGCHAHRKDHVRTRRRRLSTRQGERPQEEPALWYLAFGPPASRAVRNRSLLCEPLHLRSSDSLSGLMQGLVLPLSFVMLSVS